jgi:hypothetical protein
MEHPSAVAGRRRRRRRRRRKRAGKKVFVILNLTERGK